MQKTKLGISLKNSYPLPIKEVIRIIAQSGFNALSPVNKNGANIAEIVNTAREYGLILQSLHAPSSRSVDMWKEDKEISTLGMAQMTESLELCHEHEIPIMVAHIWQGYEPVDIPKDAGIENHGKLIEKAKEYGVIVVDAYHAWKKLSEYGVDVTELLSNKLNHPTRAMHKLFADLLYDEIIKMVL